MKEIIDLLGSGNLSEAIERLLLIFQNDPNKYKVCVLFKTRYQNLLEEEYKGIITQDANRVERTKLTSNILEFVIQVQSGNFDDNVKNDIDNLNQIVDCNIPQIFNSSEHNSNNLILNPPRQVNTNEDFIFDANLTLIKGNFESENFNNSYGLALLFTDNKVHQLAGVILHLIVDGDQCGCTISMQHDNIVLAESKKIKLLKINNNFSISRLNGLFECSINEHTIIKMDQFFELNYAYPGIYLGNSRAIRLSRFAVFGKE